MNCVVCAEYHNLKILFKFPNQAVIKGGLEDYIISLSVTLLGEAAHEVHNFIVYRRET